MAAVDYESVAAERPAPRRPGRLLKVDEGATLPEACAKCGRRDGLIPVGCVHRKRRAFTYFLCQRHRRIRSDLVMWQFGLVGVSFVFMLAYVPLHMIRFVEGVRRELVLVEFGMVLLLLAAYAAMEIAKGVRIVRVKRHTYWVAGVHRCVTSPPSNVGGG